MTCDGTDIYICGEGWYNKTPYALVFNITTQESIHVDDYDSQFKSVIANKDYLIAVGNAAAETSGCYDGLIVIFDKSLNVVNKRRYSNSKYTQLDKVEVSYDKVLERDVIKCSGSLLIGDKEHRCSITLDCLLNILSVRIENSDED